MTEEVFEKRYAQTIARTDDYTIIKPLSSLVLECAHIIHEENADAIMYVNRIQKDLFDKGIIPFMITSVRYRNIIDKMPENEIKDFLKYVLLAYMYKDEYRWRENCKETKNEKIDIAGIIALIVLTAWVFFLISIIIIAIIHFTWWSLLTIPVFLIVLICSASLPLMLMFSKDFRTQFRQTIKQAHDVV